MSPTFQRFEITERFLNSLFSNPVRWITREGNELFKEKLTKEIKMNVVRHSTEITYKHLGPFYPDYYYSYKLNAIYVYTLLPKMVLEMALCIYTNIPNIPSSFPLKIEICFTADKQLHEARELVAVIIEWNLYESMMHTTSHRRKKCGQIVHFGLPICSYNSTWKC